MLKFKTTNIITIILATILIVINVYFLSIPKFLFFLLAIFWLFFTIMGSFNIGWNYHLNAFNKNINILERKIAITFDDGPNKKYTPQVLALLKKHNAVATFFCIGKHAEQRPKIIKRIISEGHLIGNHSYSHSNNFGFYNVEQVIEELQKTTKIIKEIIGEETTYFRPPFGVTNPAIAKALKHTKHNVFGWNIRSLDTVINSKQKIVNRITKRIKPGSIILLHDSHNKIEFVLEQLLIFLQENNYETVSLETLSNTKTYA